VEVEVHCHCHRDFLMELDFREDGILQRLILVIAILLISVDGVYSVNSLFKLGSKKETKKSIRTSKDSVFKATFSDNPILINSEALDATSVFSIDLDKDGDMDVLSSSFDDNKISWYENLGIGSFISHTITTNALGAESVYAADMDNDGDIDVLSASFEDNSIYLYTNNGNQLFTQKLISSNAIDAFDVFAKDLDGDNDLDVLSASRGDNKISWYKNNGLGQFVENQISTSAEGALSVYSIDLDSDGDNDILSASRYDDKIAWYENNGSGNFTTHVISDTATWAWSVSAADLDNDGDIDVVTALRLTDSIVVYENQGFNSFIAHVISTTVDGVRDVHIADLDKDGKMDILSASNGDNKIAWFENKGSLVFESHVISQTALGVHSVYTSDFDGDGDLDVVSALSLDNKIVWFENVLLNVTPVISSISPSAGPVGTSIKITGFYFGESQSNSTIKIGVTEESAIALGSIIWSDDVIVGEVPIELEQGIYKVYLRIGDSIVNINTDFRITKLQSIVAAKDSDDGNVVTVKGIAITASLESATRTSFFIQDNGVGINIFKLGTPSKEIALGDSVMVTGTLDTYNGLRELAVADISTDITVMNTGNPVPAPRNITYLQFYNAKSLESDLDKVQGSLVRLNGLTTDPSTWPNDASSSSKNITAKYTINDSTIAIRLLAGTEAIGTTPSASLDLIGVASSFKSSQLLPRYSSDLIPYYNVTFQLDMSDAMAKNNFKPAEHAVTIAGNFNDWSARVDTLFEGSTAGMFEKTIELKPGDHQFKFLYSSVQYQQYEWDADLNREISISSDSVTQIFVPNVLFNDYSEGNDTTLKQIDLPITFDLTDVEYSFVDFGGNSSSIVVDPQNSSNKVVKVIKTLGAEIWAGTIIGKDGFVHPIPFTQDSTFMNVRVWSAAAGVPVRLRLENVVNNQETVETEVMTTKAGEWEVLNFDFSKHVEGTQALNLAFVFNKASIYFNFWTIGADDIYYFDNVRFGEFDSESIDLEIKFPVDFENLDINWTDAFTGFDGGSAEVIINPYKTEANMSDKVVKMVKNAGGQPWAGAYLSLSKPIDLEKGTMFSMNVWAPSQTSKVILIFENPVKFAERFEKEVGVGLANAWTKVDFDFNEANKTFAYQNVLIIFDNGTTGDGSAAFTYYFDDIVQYAPIPITQNLVAYYPFTNGSFADLSGNNNDGSNNGATETLDRFGNAKSAMNFNGVDNYIKVENSPELNFGTNDFTLTGWLKYPAQVGGSANYAAILIKSKIGSPWDGFTLFVDEPSSGNVQFRTSALATTQLNTTGLSLNNDVWYQFAAIREGDQLKLYVDGLLKGTKTVAITNISNDQPLWIGVNHESTTSQNYNGSLDDIRIYNRALSADEIKALYHLESAPESPQNLLATAATASQIQLTWSSNTEPDLALYKIYKGTDRNDLSTVIIHDLSSAIDTVYTDIDVVNGKSYYYSISAVDSSGYESERSETVSAMPVAPFVDGLVAYYPFNGNTNDESGNGNDGTTAGTFSFQTEAGKDAIRLNGNSFVISSSGGHVLVPSFQVLGLTNKFTISMWVKEEGMAYQHGEAYFGFGDDPNFVGFGHYGNSLTYATKQSESKSINIDYPGYGATYNKWIHHLLTYENDTLKAFIDGAEVKKDVINLTINTSFSAIGRHYWSGGSSTRFIGWVDDFRIYNRALSEEEIKALYYLESAPETPQNFTAIASNSQIQLTWSPNTEPDLALYKIYKGTDPNDLSTVIIQDLSSEIDTAYTDSDVVNGTTYYYAISAVDSSGYESTRSEVVNTKPNTLDSPDLIAYYPFTNGSFADVSGNKYNGTSTDVVATFDRFGNDKNAMSFNGETSRIVVSSDNNLVPRNITVSLWAKSNSDVWNKPGMLLSKRNSYILHTDEGSKKLSAYVWVNGNWVSTPYTDVPKSITDWNLYSMTYDGQTLRLFVNGVEISSVNQTGEISSGLNGSLYFGYDNASGNRYFSGLLDEIRIYNRALSDSEIKDLYILESAPITPEKFSATLANKEILLTWSPNTEPDLAIYKIYKGTDPNDLSTVIIHDLSSEIDTSYTDSDIQSASNFYYSIAAVDSLGYESSRSDTLHVAVNHAIATLSVEVLEDEIEISQPFSLNLKLTELNPIDSISTLSFSLNYLSDKVDFIQDSTVSYQFFGDNEVFSAQKEQNSSKIAIQFSAEENTQVLGSGTLSRLRFAALDSGKVQFTISDLVAKNKLGIDILLTSDQDSTQIKLPLSFERVQTPQNFTAKGVHQQIRLAWDFDEKQVQAYFLLYKRVTEQTFVLVDSVAQTKAIKYSYFDNEVENGNEYEYRIQAKQSEDSLSLFSPILKAIPKSPELSSNLNRISPDHTIQIEGIGFGEKQNNATARFVLNPNASSSSIEKNTSTESNSGVWINLQPMDFSDSEYSQESTGLKERNKQSVSYQSYSKPEFLNENDAVIQSWSDTLIVLSAPENLSAGNYKLDLMIRDKLIEQQIEFSVLPTIDVWPGDTNNDGRVVAADLMYISIFYGQKTTDSLNSISWKAWKRPTWQADGSTPRRVFADANGDGQINVFDLDALDVNYGKTPVQKMNVVPSAIIQSGTDSVLIVAEWMKIDEKLQILFTLPEEDQRNWRGLALSVQNDELKQFNGKMKWVNHADFSGGELRIIQLNKETGALEFGQAGDVLTKLSSIGILGMFELEGFTNSETESLFDVKKVRIWNKTGERPPVKIQFKQVLQTNTEWISEEKPKELALYQNYPNPFNPQTSIQFDVAEAGHVQLEVFDIQGRRIAILQNGMKAAGRYKVRVQAQEWSSGVYLYRLQAGENVIVKKMVLVK